jgi:hypothetical protein
VASDRRGRPFETVPCTRAILLLGYWSWWRRNRGVVDCSHGWGGNSQWRTDFRRDYVVGDKLHYNVDRHPSESRHRPWHTLPPEQPLSLLRFRCSTTVDLGPDQWPFYDHYVEPWG